MTTFTTTETRGGLIYTTIYRRTARTTTRLSMSETAAAPPALKQVMGQLMPPHRTALHALRDLPLDSQREQATVARRLRTADLSPFTDLSLLLDDLIRLGLVIRESQFKAGGATRIRLALTPAGRAICEQLFGSPDAEMRRLAALVDALLPAVTQPVLADLLTAQLSALQAGQSPALSRLTGPAVGPDHPRYETTLRFLARLGELPAGQSLEWKELAAELFPEIGGSKQLQGWQTFFEEITQANLGLSLADCSILTEETLYHVPLAGTICLANGSPLPGRFPALSNIDIALTKQVATPATWLLLVENRAVLLALGRQDYPARHNCLVCCTDGMVKHALIELVVKLSPRPSVLWVDWDIGGLRIASAFRRRLPDVVIVPHPGVVGEPVEVSSFTNHPDPAIVELALAIGRYGAIEQERLLRQVLTWDLTGLAGVA
ncbi:MAG: hypothetical protein BroJett011_17730 [Chloroflexota bacterium]|nr:MAG: hypothetical protein BroJett011_17730 [Chloroflexota bacterium]